MSWTDYNKVMATYQPLKRKDQYNLFKLYNEQGNKRAFMIIFLSYIPLVHGVVKRYAVKEGIVDDLLQEGMIALLNAIRNFDPDRAVSFSTYASRSVTSVISRYEKTKGRQIPFKPTSQRVLLYNYTNPV